MSIQQTEEIQELLQDNNDLHRQNGLLVSENCHLKDEIIALYRRLDRLSSVPVVQS